MAEVMGDWLNPDTEAKQKRDRTLALEFAENYLIFTEGRGKRLLEFWESTLCKKKVPVDSSVQVYAAHNAVREFVEGMKAQIEVATNGELRNMIKGI